GNDISRLSFKVGIPKLLGVERSARVRVLHELIAHAPTAIASLNQIHPARLVAAVGIVIAREQISILIEDQVLRIAQSERKHFQLGTIRVAAENAAGLRLTYRPAIG